MANLAASWATLREEIELRSGNLASEMADAWTQVQTLAAMLRERLESLEAWSPKAPSLDSLEALFGPLAGQLLFEPVAMFKKKRPLLSVVTAIREYEAGLDGLVQRLPLSCEYSPRDLPDLAGAHGSTFDRWRSMATRNVPKVMPLRAAVSGHLQKHLLQRGNLDGAFQLEMAKSCLHLLGPWQIHREHGLATLSGARVPAVETERLRWVARAEQQQQTMRRILESYAAWAASAAARVTAALIRSPSEPSRQSRERRSEIARRRMGHWARQQRAVQAVLDLEVALAELGMETTGDCRGSLDSIHFEHQQLLSELDLAVEWLESWSLGRTDFPPPQVRLMSVEERAREWARRVLHSARSRLPATVEVADPHHGLPGRGGSSREVQPENAFRSALRRLGMPALIESLGTALPPHQLVVREIERVREVVSYGDEAARTEGESGREVAFQAVQNGLSLLRYQRETTPEVAAAAEAGMVRAEAAMLLDCHVALEKGRVGLLAHLTRQRGLAALDHSQDMFLSGLRAGSRRGWMLARSASEHALVRLGWMTPPRPHLEPVSRRAQLRQLLDLQENACDLPAIYRRLFRLTPIEDPRFLVGREAEMAGLAEALAQWKAGMRASVILVGARGSGKTSLLNCAASQLFAEMAVVRGQLSARTTTRDQMRAVLRNILGLPSGADLSQALCDERRIVIIEELERSFLRTVNGFEALRELLGFIYETSDSTLWIFSINETAFRYLSAVAGLGNHFSHRINAMSVRSEDLTGAILQRHDLSGLRLEFAPLAGEDRRIDRARRLVGLERDPEQLFFESLYRQSEGIFRAAFELWQSSIARVDGGVVYMRQPLVPQYAPLLAELDLRDHQILQAILQHGGMTVEEVAESLRLGLEETGRHVKRLRFLDILQPEPECDGFRVRPEAGLLVREALHRQNLW